MKKFIHFLLYLQAQDTTLDSTESLTGRLRSIFNPHKEVQELAQRLSADLKDLKEAILNKQGERPLDMPDGEPVDEPRVDWTAQIDPNLSTFLDEQKTAFWNDVIGKYLQPLRHSEEEQRRLRTELVSLRNEVALLFVFLNAGWALGILLLQLSSVESSAFTLEWVLCEVRRPLNETLEGYEIEAGAVSNYLPLDPINFVFILFFLIILFIQGKSCFKSIFLENYFL
jgi:hypothetical protein